MAKKNSIVTETEWEKEFLSLFKMLCYSRNGWEVWADLMTVMACTISNAVDRNQGHFEKREHEYETCMKRIGSVDTAARLFGIVAMALEKDPEQDFLGKLYMLLDLGNHWKGQFFTPYDVCKCMARITIDGNGNPAEEIKKKGYVSAADSCIGGGAMLIALANVFREKQINYQKHVIFVGQDVDRIVAMMAYIQLSLLGCPGYIIVGDSLLHPATGHVLFPQEDENRELWIMPMFLSDIWKCRRMFALVDANCRRMSTQDKKKREKYFMFFDFTEQEEDDGKSISGL